MNILFVHQSFPGQYIHIVRALAAQGGHRLVALGHNALQSPLPAGVEYRRYPIQRRPAADVHNLAAETEVKVIRGEACANAALQLAAEGFQPDLICAHPGWGETLFLPDVWPDVPLLCYQEFFYHTRGLDTDFDPELQGQPDVAASSKVRMKNAYLHLTLEASHWNVTPTAFQHSTFPKVWQPRISTIHDGIDIHAAAPATSRHAIGLTDGTRLEAGDPIVTFVNRRFEPTRGCHTFVRAIPEVLRQHPDAHLVVVGHTTGVSYGAACPQGEWKEHFLKEIEGQYDPTHLHFTGPLPHQQFLKLLQISACHVYLTYPFVLSWSLLEAMACGCAVVGSATAPVKEVIRDGHNGLLVDFFSPADLANAIHETLANREHGQIMGRHARETILRDYSLDVCLPRQLSLMQLVASGAFPRA